MVISLLTPLGDPVPSLGAIDRDVK
jgi:hypothetical protein